MNVNDNWNKVNTKNELIKLLKKYDGILSKTMIDYLNCLIGLEFSVIRDYISNKDRKALSELEIYKQVAIYNIYNRALTLFRKDAEEMQFKISADREEGLNVSIKMNDRYIELYDFDFRTPQRLSGHVSDDYKIMKIGDISLYQTFENAELRNAELNKVMAELEAVNKAENPYSDNSDIYVINGQVIGGPRIGGPRERWFSEHDRAKAELARKFAELDSKKELSDDDKRMIEITNYVYDLLTNDYGLNDKSFKDDSENSVSWLKQPENNLEKTLVKKMPQLTITKNVKYI